MSTRLACAVTLLLAGCGASTATEAPIVLERPIAAPSERPQAPIEPEAPRPVPPVSRSLPPPSAPGEANAHADHFVSWNPGIPPEGASRFFMDAGRLVVFGATTITAIHGDGATPSSEVEQGLELANSTDGALPDVAANDEAFFFLARGNRAAAAQRSSLAPLWSTQLRSEEERSGSNAVISAGNAFIAVLGDEIVSLDPASGAILWRQPLEDQTTQKVHAGAGVVVVRRHRGLAGLDARTGAELWADARFNSLTRIFDPAGDLLPVLVDTDLYVLDLRTGTERAHVHHDVAVPWGRNVLLDGESVHMLVADDDDWSTIRVRSYELASGRLRWTSSRFDTDTSGFHTSLGLDDGVVVACTNYWTARGIDGASGRDRWTLHTRGGCFRPRAWRPREGAPNVLVLGFSPESMHARAAGEPPRHTAELRGSVRCGDRAAARATLWIGGEHVRADASGRFRARVTASQWINVVFNQYERNDHDFCTSDTVWLDLSTGERAHTVDFDRPYSYCPDCI
jgi:hypothetical protein